MNPVQKSKPTGNQRDDWQPIKRFVVAMVEAFKPIAFRTLAENLDAELVKTDAQPMGRRTLRTMLKEIERENRIACDRTDPHNFIIRPVPKAEVVQTETLFE